jgi:hypothetical protein
MGPIPQANQLEMAKQADHVAQNAIEMQVPVPKDPEAANSDVEKVPKASPRSSKLEKADELAKQAREIQAAVEMPKPWGNCILVWLISLGFLLGLAGAVMHKTNQMFQGYFLIALVTELCVSLPLVRKYPWKGRPQVWAPVLVEGHEQRLAWMTIENPEKKNPVVVDGEKRQSGYDGELYDIFIKASHVKRFFSNSDAKNDVIKSVKRLLLIAAVGLVIAIGTVMFYTVQTDVVHLDYSVCTNAPNVTECKLNVFYDMVIGDDCLSVAVNEESGMNIYDSTPSKLNSYMDVWSLSPIASTTSFIFVNIGTMITTFVYLKKGDPNMLKTMWGTSLGFTVFNVFAALFGHHDPTYSPALTPLLIAFFHAIHMLMNEIASTPPVFAARKFNRSIAFATGLFVHFLVGIILVGILFYMNIFIKMGNVPPEQVTIVLGLGISLGDVILQTVFGQLGEVPYRAAGLQMLAYQMTTYQVMRTYFVSLSLEKLFSTSLVNCGMQIGQRAVGMMIKAYQWNRNLKAQGPHAISQYQGVFAANLLASMASEHVAILASCLYQAFGNPAVLMNVGKPLEPATASTVLLQFFIQFGFELVSSVVIIVMTVSFFNFRLWPFFTTLGPLFYVGLVLSLIVTVALGFKPALECYFCEGRDVCMMYAATGNSQVLTDAALEMGS